ncbi:MAG TPA: DUF5693 family protein [bacterium]|nr:DUF5693 family protein [bacterium]
MPVILRRFGSRYPVLAGCVVAGLVAALVVLVHRYHLEQANRTVEISVDGDDWMTLARRTGIGRDSLYDSLYRAGARSVTLYAVSLKRLADSGRLTVMTGSDVINAARAGSVAGPLGDLLRIGQISPGNTYVVGALPALERVRAGLAVQLLPHTGQGRTKLLTGSGPVLEIAGRGQEIEEAPLGLLPEDAAQIRAQRLAIEARMRNFREVAPGGLEAFFTGLRSLGEDRLTLIFDGPQVLGYDRLIPDVAEQMKSAGFAFGQIESFTARRRQRGEPELALRVQPAVLRVFSLTPEELATLNPDDARDKYVLAARERNVRILYVRPFLTTPAGVDEVQANLDYVASIAGDLQQAGYRMGKAVPLPDVTIYPVWFLLMALGTLAALAIAAAEVMRILARPIAARSPSRPIAPGPLYAGVGGGVVLTMVALALHRVTLWSQLLAFLAALAFPTLSLMGFLVETGPGRAGGSAAGRPGAHPAGSGVARGGVWLPAESIGRLWALSGVTALGGLMVAALLSQWAFLLEIRQFLGVKLVHVLPIAVLGLLLVAAEAPVGTLWARLRSWGRQPLLLEYGIAVILVGVAVVFALGRTGNTGLPLLGALELRTRVLLSHLVIARPRTKEFLIGDPFMVLAFALMALGARKWILPVALVGAIGQVGLVNSFSHIHTPLVYVFLRTIYALAFGSVIGAGLIGVVCWTRRWWSPDARDPDASADKVSRAGGKPPAGEAPRAGGPGPRREPERPAGSAGVPPRR